MSQSGARWQRREDARRRRRLGVSLEAWKELKQRQMAERRELAASVEREVQKRLQGEAAE